MRHATDTEAVEMLLRALFEGTASDNPWVDDRAVEWEMEELVYHKPFDMLVPYQYLLLTLASQKARAVTCHTTQMVRTAADRLLALLDIYERAAGEHPCPAWAKFSALLEAPFPVQTPPHCDTRDADAMAVMIRDVRFGGSWQKNLDWLARHGSEEQRRVNGARIRQLADFEQVYGINLADLLFGEQARAEHARLAEANKGCEPGLCLRRLWPAGGEADEP